MPLFHVHGLIGVTLASLAAGGTVVMPARLRMRTFWEAVAEHDVSWVSAVPTLLAGIPAGPRSGHRLRFLRSASSPLPPTLAARLEDDLGVPVLEAYGMTEATHQMASNPLPPAKRRPGSVGTATNIELDVVDKSWTPVGPGEPGEVVVRGASITSGYFDNPGANAESFRDGWFRTGDIGRLSADGYLRLVGRVKEMINRAGEKISPREVNEVLLTHPAVAEAATYGAPDAKYGEVVHAAVVTREAVEPKALMALLSRPARSLQGPGGHPYRGRHPQGRHRENRAEPARPGAGRRMRIAVFGAGAIGGLVGGMLARSGSDVCLIARGDHLAAIRRDGLRVLGLDTDIVVRVPATDDPAEAGPVDAVLVGLKAYSYASCGPLIEPLLGPATTMVQPERHPVVVLLRSWRTA